MDIKTSIKGMKHLEQTLGQAEKQANRAAQQAINRTLQRSKTKMANVIGDKLNLQKKIIRELIAIRKASKARGLNGKLIVKDKLVSLIEYKAKQNRKGISFKIFRSGPRKLVRHAFIAEDRFGRDTAFRRDGKARLRIKPLYGTKVTDVAEDKVKDVGKFASEFLVKEYQRLLGLKKIKHIQVNYLH